MEQNRDTRYQKDSLTLSGTVMLGTGVMIGIGIFAFWLGHSGHVMKNSYTVIEL